jgi:acyl-CoA thioesterase-1
MLRRIDKDVPSGTDIAILQPGGNDLRFFGTKQQRAANIAEMERRLRARSINRFAMYYNFVRIHKMLRTTPAMAANVTKRLWEIGDIVDVLEAWESNRDDMGRDFATVLA